MNCLRCHGTGIEPSYMYWEKEENRKCLECENGKINFKFWLAQSYHTVIRAIVGYVPDCLRWD